MTGSSAIDSSARLRVPPGGVGGIPNIRDVKRAENRLSKRTSPYYVWLCALMASFAYERPLVEISQYDRLNPRLFDCVVLLGIALLAIKPLANPLCGERRLFKLWKMLVACFCLCSMAWALLFLPQDMALFSGYFALKYVEGLIAIAIARRVMLTEDRKRYLCYLIVAGGIFVAAYAIPQYLSGDVVISLTKDKTYAVGRGVLIGPLGPTYFHIAQFSLLAASLALALTDHFRDVLRRMCGGLAATFVIWPAVACGSRAGLYGAAIVVGVLCFSSARLRWIALGMVLVLGILWSSGGLKLNTADLTNASFSLNRLLAFQDDPEYGTVARLSVVSRFDPSDYYLAGYPMPFIGGGFYVAPIDNAGDILYRVGFGIHNIYLFAFEQAGIPGMALFGAFLWVAVSSLRRVAAQAVGVDSAMAKGVLAFLIAIIIVGLGGGVFWQGFGTENFNTMIVLCVVIAARGRGSPGSLRHSLAEPAGPSSSRKGMVSPQ